MLELKLPINQLLHNHELWLEIDKLIEKLTKFNWQFAKIIGNIPKNITEVIINAEPWILNNICKN